MNNNDDFYKNFNIEPQKSGGFKFNFLIPFLSGIFGTILVIGLAFGIPNIKEKLLNYNPTEITTSTNSSDIEIPNTGVAIGDNVINNLSFLILVLLNILITILI